MQKLVQKLEIKLQITYQIHQILSIFKIFFPQISETNQKWKER